MTALAADAPVNRREFRVRYSENIKRRDQSVCQGQTHSSNSFIAPRAGQDPFLAAYHATVPPKQAKKLHVFHKRHFWKSTNVQERTAPTEQPVVATPHSQKDPGVMRKSVGQPINSVSRQANPEVTAGHIRVGQYTSNFIQASLRDFSIDMHEPEHVAMRGACTDIHLHGPIGFTPDELIAKAHTEISCVIGASAVGDNNLRFWRSVTQMLKKWAYK
jgi:hypothetical protein